jgi:hypothetical protein
MKIISFRKLEVAEYILTRRIRVVPLSTVALDAGYPDSDSLDFPQKLQTKARIVKSDLKYASSEIILMEDIALFSQQLIN